jgi:S-adenosylmethionine:tRNA ribosyltransferase-isomerase
MQLTELNYELPPERIAQRPLAERDASRMLLLDRRSGAWEDRAFREFPALLRGDELLVVNNARVIPARLLGRRAGVRSGEPAKEGKARREFLTSEIEVLLVRQIEAGVWEALVRPGRKIGVGERIIFGDGALEAEVESRGEYGLRRLRFRVSAGSFEETVNRLGHVPLPPYIQRGDEASDRERYQTIFASRAGAVAAPTAGLHFTPSILSQLRERRIEIVEITLEVGLGTFEPVRTERLEDHPIHHEAYEISESAAAAIENARQRKRPILAVGTTVVRALEDAAEKSARRNSGAAADICAGRAEAGIFLYPGKEFRVVNQLLTNFHLPQSSLLALVAAFAGRENVLRAYLHAVEAEYRFYSYGDCMLIR